MGKWDALLKNHPQEALDLLTDIRDELIQTNELLAAILDASNFLNANTKEHKHGKGKGK